MKKDWMLLCDPVRWEDLFRVQPAASLHWQCPLKPWKWPLPPSPAATTGTHRWHGYNAFIQEGRQAKPWPYCPPFFHKKDRKERKRRKNGTSMTSFQKRVNPAHWAPLISKYILVHMWSLRYLHYPAEGNWRNLSEWRHRVCCLSHQSLMIYWCLY